MQCSTVYELQVSNDSDQTVGPRSGYETASALNSNFTHVSMQNRQAEMLPKGIENST